MSKQTLEVDKKSQNFLQFSRKMCKDCVKTIFPQRETLCTETGVYIQNFAGCSKCNEQNRAPDSLISKGPGTIEEVDDDITKEITAFDRKWFYKN